GVPHHGHNRALQPGVVDRAPEERQGVHLADGRVDEVGLVPLPARLVLLRPAVVVDGEEHPAELAGGGADPHRRLPAVGAHLEEGPVDGHRLGRLVERLALVGRHEPPGRLRVPPELGVDHHPSWWMMASRSRRAPGLKSVPIVWATGMRAPCITLSGRPSSSAAACSWIRWSVVQQVPRPRDRAASMKLQVAGRSEPQMAAWRAIGPPSVRPWITGITCTGTSPMCSARYWAELM